MGSVSIFGIQILLVVDENDINELNDEGDDEGAGSMMLIVDNGPNDMNPEIGKYAAHLHI